MDIKTFVQRVEKRDLFSDEITSFFLREEKGLRLENVEMALEYDFSTGDEDYRISRQRDCWLFQQPKHGYIFVDDGRLLEYFF